MVEAKTIPLSPAEMGHQTTGGISVPIIGIGPCTQRVTDGIHGEGAVIKVVVVGRQIVE